MAEPAVALSLRTDGAGPAARDQIMRNVLAIAVRPSFTPADLGALKLVPTTPRPAPDRGRTVRRAEPAKARNTIRARFLAEATRELYERLGEFERRVVGGAVILRWDLGEGDGIVVARKSTEEARSGETIGAQLQAILRYCDAAGHKPRIVVAVLSLSGRAHFEERHDFNEVFESFRRGEASWVVYRGMDRLARSMTWTALFVHYVREYGIGLHIAQLHKEVDLHNPYEVAQLWVLGMTAELEAASSGDRMYSALSAQMRDAGKGWAKTGGLGFTRDEDNFIIVDEEEWPFIVLIHELYASVRSIAIVQRTLEADYGLRLAQGSLHRMLRDERYVTGEIKTKDPSRAEGFRVDVIHLPRPIPRSLWEHNQMLLDIPRGKTTKTPAGQFVTRGIPVYHARCMDPDDPSQSAHQLRSSRIKSGKYRFAHRPTDSKQRSGYRTPDGCRGWSLEVEVVERAVIRGVRTMLEDNDALHRGIALGRANREPDETRGLFTADDRTRLEQEIRRLERYRDGLWQRHLDRIREGRRLKPGLLEEEVQIVDDEIAHANHQLTLDTQLRRRTPRSTTIPARIQEVLTDEPPDDPELRLRRWAIVNQLVSRVVVHDTDDGISVELYGPLVPDSDDAAAWDPLGVCGPVTPKTSTRPEVPQPFRTPAKPERLRPAYRWRSETGCFATETLTCERIVAGLRLLAVRYPTGPLVGIHGVGVDRWTKLAVERNLGLPNAVWVTAVAQGTTAAALVREAVGARSAVVLGRVLVASREDVVWVMEAAISDGFSFGAAWTLRAVTFCHDKPYSFVSGTIYDWAKRFADGDLAGLIADAERLAAKRADADNLP